MAKNKLLTIPIEEDKRERLNQHCAAAGVTVSQLITKYIDAVLDGSIDSSISTSTSIDSIDVEEVVSKVIDRLRHLAIPVDPQYVKIERFDEATRNLSLAIAEVKNSAWLTDCSIQNLKKFVNYSDTEQPIDEPIEQSIDIDNPIEQPIDIDEPIDTPIDGYTLDDTRRYLEEKNNYNRTCQNKFNRVSQTQMSSDLNTYHYPHPLSKAWDRNEVRKICKLWEIATA